MKNKICQVVVITGASSGIGMALANEYAKRGAKLVLAARRIDKLMQIKAEIQNTEVLIVETDVCIETDCKRLVEVTVSEFGRINVFINNAGVSMRALFADCEIGVLKQLFDVNFWGTVYCSKYALPHLIETKGSLVGVISVAGYIGLPGRSGYSASKYAVRGFLDTIRVENLKSGLHVMVAAPGFTSSEIREKALLFNGAVQGNSPRDESKMMTPERCAYLIANAIKKRKRSLVMTLVNGKMAVFFSKLWPKLVDRIGYWEMSKEINSPLKS